MAQIKLSQTKSDLDIQEQIKTLDARLHALNYNLEELAESVDRLCNCIKSVGKLDELITTVHRLEERNNNMYRMLIKQNEELIS